MSLPILFIAIMISGFPLTSIHAAVLSTSEQKAKVEENEYKKNLTARIDNLEKKQQTSINDQAVASKVDEAKWELLVTFLSLIGGLLLLILGSGVGVFFAVKQFLQARFDLEIQERGQTLKREIEDKFDTSRKLMNARIWGNLGAKLTELLDAYEPKSNQWNTFWTGAENQVRQALIIVEGLPKDDPLWEERVCTYKNNLAFLLTIRGDPNDGDEALKLSTYAFKKASQYSDGYHYEDTHGWALLMFAQNTEEKDKAIKMLQELYEQPRTPRLPQGWIEKRKVRLLGEIA